MVVCGVHVWEVPHQWMLASGRTSKLLGRGCWVGGWRSSCGLTLIAGHTHTDLDKVTDAGLKTFSAALGSSTSITTVKLACKSDWRVRMSGSMCWCHAGVFGRCVNLV